MLVPETLATIDKIFQAVFERPNPFSLEQVKSKFAFDIVLPEAVTDAETGEETWTSVPDAKLYMTEPNTWKRDEWMLPKRPVKNLQELIEIWQSVDYMTTDRVYHSENVHASDPIYDSENVYGSTNCGKGKNLVFCNDSYNCTFALACQRSQLLNFCIRVDDSGTCSNSYNVICSNHITNSLFIQDCGSLNECIFCSHLSQKEFCIANMQFEKDEYYYLKSQIIDWILQA